MSTHEAGCTQEEAHLQEIDELHYLGLQVFYARKRRGWSQEEMGERTGLSQSRIARIEGGEANPTVQTLSRLACTLECGITDLFSPIGKRGRVDDPSGFKEGSPGRQFDGPGSSREKSETRDESSESEGEGVDDTGSASSKVFSSAKDPQESRAANDVLAQSA